MTGPMDALNVYGSYRGISGHDHHVRQFVRGLHRRGLRIRLLDLPRWHPVKLPVGERDPWFESLDRRVGSRAGLHFCMPHQVEMRRGHLHLNYTMFEASRIPSLWVRHNLRHDLVILPTPACAGAWTGTGFPEDRIRICPLGVDPQAFRPGRTPLPLVDGEGQSVDRYRTRVLNVSDLGPRKNLLSLLATWIRTTRRGQDAILILKLGSPGRRIRDRFEKSLAEEEKRIGKSRHEAAPVLFLERILPEEAMPALFAAATHYWSMSHGEGWDQPMMEAAASGLQLLAPAHSAYLTYLDGTTAHLIPIARIPARFDSDDGLQEYFRGAEWWSPDEDAAAHLLEQAIQDRLVPLDPRERVAREFTWEEATRRLLEILREVGTQPPRLERSGGFLPHRLTHRVARVLFRLRRGWRRPDS